jgi:pSer/pThr/pTyr-binding forkhead associated (FHA) protein
LEDWDPFRRLRWRFGLFFFLQRSFSTMPESALELFRNACGLRAPLALECQDASRTMGGADTYQLDCPFALIGRDPRSHLVLHGAEVSRNHAFFQVVDGRIFCIDLNSRTQLLWEGETEKRAHGWLDPGFSVRIGSYAIRRVGTDLSLNRSTPCPDPLVDCPCADPGSPPLPRAGLELPIRAREGEQPWWMDSRLALVGRSESCQIMLRDASVSRFHAALVRTAKGVWIVDLQSRAGVLLNGVRVRWAWLEDDDTVRIGQFTFILRYETVPEQISRRVVPLEAGASPSVSNKAAQHGKSATTLAVRSSVSPATPASVVKSAPALRPDVLVPERVAGWEQGITVPAQQLAMWQQQMRMMESFHQDMILMVQMFMAMHREHRVAIRDELERVQKLTRDLNVLQAKLSQTEGSTRENRSPDVERPVREVGTPRSSGRNGRQPAQGAKPPNDALPGQSRSTQPPDASRHAAAGTPLTTSADQSRKAAGSSAAPISHAELHSQLTQRITELQRERQTYWQRILSAINK